MREWHKPTVEETESGMEVTSCLPAELPLPMLPVQIFLIWYPDRFHPHVMRFSSRLPMLKSSSGHERHRGSSSS